MGGDDEAVGLGVEAGPDGQMEDVVLAPSLGGSASPVAAPSVARSHRAVPSVPGPASIPKSSPSS